MNKRIYNNSPCAKCNGPKERGRGRRLCLACADASVGQWKGNERASVASIVRLKAYRGSRQWKAFSNAASDRRRQALAGTGVLSSRIGIDSVHYNRLLDEQDGVCALCHREEITLDRFGNVRRLSVDHDHATGKVRSLLCARCNMGLGLFGDNPELMRSAADYVEKHAGIAATRKAE